MFRISRKHPHIEELDFRRLVFLKKVINGDDPVENDPVLHSDSDSTKSCMFRVSLTLARLNNVNRSLAGSLVGNCQHDFHN